MGSIWIDWALGAMKGERVGPPMSLLSGCLKRLKLTVNL